MVRVTLSEKILIINMRELGNMEINMVKGSNHHRVLCMRVTLYRIYVKAKVNSV